MTGGPDTPFGSRARIAAEGARAATLGSLERQPTRVRITNRIFRGVLFGAIVVALIGLIALLVDAFIEGESRLSLSLITDSTSRIADQAGLQAGDPRLALARRPDGA